METRAAKRKATVAENHNQPLKKKRVVLEELPNLNNAIVPQTVHSDKQKTLNNPNHRKTTATKNTAARVNTDELDGPSEIYKYLRTLEMEKKRRPMMDYKEQVQIEITSDMRGILVDWLVEVAEAYTLLPDTLHLSVSYIDRFLSVHPVSQERLQLLGVSSMLIASYYGARGFNSIACADKNAPSLQFEFLSYYLAELSLLGYDCLMFLPSLVAASVFTNSSL